MFVWMAALLLITSSVISAYDYNDFSLHRIARAPQQAAALLVPYPRVGKRSQIPDQYFLNNDGHDFHVDHLLYKRLYMARVGKRGYVYAPRIGRRK